MALPHPLPHVRFRPTRYLSALILLGLLAACDRNPPGPDPTPDAPRIDAFSVSPQAVAVGEAVTFEWQVSGVGAVCTLDVNSDGTPEYTLTGDACLTGSQTHTFDQAGSFSATLTASANGNDVSQQSSTIVIESGGAPDDFTTLTWESATAQERRVAEAQGIAVGGKLYVFGGFDSQKRCCTPTERAQVYDPEADTWTPIAPLPPMNDTGQGGVTHAGTATDGTDIFLVSGYTSNSSGTGQIFGTREAWRYDVASDSYTRLPDLPIERSAGQLEYLDGKLHYFGGTNRSRTQDTPEHFVLELDGGSSWTEAEPLPNARNHLGSAVLEGRIFAVAGQHGHDGRLVTQSDVHAYDPATDAWEQLADLPIAISHISNSTFVMKGRIIVVGGERAHASPVDDIFAYDPDTDIWSSLTSLPLALQSAVAAELNGNIVVTGGSGGGWRAESYRGIPQN